MSEPASSAIPNRARIRSWASDRRAGRQAPEPVPGPPARVTDWRTAEGGAIKRALGPLAAEPSVAALLDFCVADSPLSQRAWTAQASELVGSARAATAEALRRIAVREQLAAGSEYFTVNCVKALALLDAETAVPLLVRLADQHGRDRLPRHHEVVARGAIRALGRVGGEQALAPLRRIKGHSPLASLRKAADAELGKVLRSAGLSHEDVPEWRAETFELNANSERRISLRSGYSANVRIVPGGKVRADYIAPNGRLLTGKLSALDIPADLAAVADLVHRIRAAVRAERTRLATLLRDQRPLDTAVWLDFYLDHPVTGPLARTLIWEISADDGETWTAGIPFRTDPDQPWRLRTEDTGYREIPAEGSVRAMRPLRATSREGKAWAARLRRWEINQAVAQSQ